VLTDDVAFLSLPDDFEEDEEVLTDSPDDPLADLSDVPPDEPSPDEPSLDDPLAEPAETVLEPLRLSVR